MQFFSVYGMIAGIAYGRMLITDISEFSIGEIIGGLASLVITLGILMFMELMIREKEKKEESDD